MKLRFLPVRLQATSPPNEFRRMAWATTYWAKCIYLPHPTGENIWWHLRDRHRSGSPYRWGIGYHQRLARLERLNDHQFSVNFYGLTWSKSIDVPKHINEDLNEATTPEEVENIISKYESALARLFDPESDFLVCDSAAELMADVLHSKKIVCQVVCGINDYGDSHSYVTAMGKNYDPTHQGYGNP